jgi:hypothetical protein
MMAVLVDAERGWGLEPTSIPLPDIKKDCSNDYVPDSTSLIRNYKAKNSTPLTLYWVMSESDKGNNDIV